MRITNTIYVLIIAIGSIAVLFYGCRQPQSQPSVTKQPEHTFTVKGSVREMNIWPEAPDNFPEHIGKAEFVSYCGICHSLKYITNQPAFPRKTWESEVEKMIEKYKAPIDSLAAIKIVDYLVLVNGK